MIENIQGLYKDITPKYPFLKAFSDHMGIEISTLRSSWFSLWAVPKNKQAETVEYMQNYIALQNKTVKPQKMKNTVNIPIKTLNRLEACLKEVSGYIEASKNLGEASTPRPLSKRRQKIEAYKKALK